MEYFSAVWLYDNGTTAYIDNTVEAEISEGTAFETLGETTDYQYFGFDRRFNMLVISVSKLGSYGALTWEYSNDRTDSTSWARLVPLDNDKFASATSYTSIKVPRSWASVIFTTSGPHSVSSVPDSTARYWLRCSAASVTTTAEIDEIQMIPYARYSSPERVAGHLQVADFSSTTQPTFNEVEDRIHEIESRIDYGSKKSWRYNIKKDEYHDFNLSGIRLWKSNARSITSLEIYNGSDWETKTQGRRGDYFFVPDEGMVYFARYFLLPARVAVVGPHWWGWGVGEFKKAVRINYVWGYDLDTDWRGEVIKSLASKMAAIELYRSHDYSIMAVSGSDKVSLDRKIDQWSIEVENEIESLRGWEVI